MSDLWDGWLVATDADRQVLDRLNDLMAHGSMLMSAGRGSGVPVLPMAPFSEWRSRSLHLLTSVLGRDSLYATEFDEWSKDPLLPSVEAGMGILRSVHHDVGMGYLTSFRELVHAEVFNDILDSADYLREQGYPEVAAVRVGVVLEQRLRQLCCKNGIDTELQAEQVPRPKKADRMNADLAKAGAYSTRDQKNVTAWLDLRNKAAYGTTSEYRPEQVELMLRGVRDFIDRYPG